MRCRFWSGLAWKLSALLVCSTLLPLVHIAGQTTNAPAQTSPAPHPSLGSEPPGASDPFAGHNAMRLEHMREDERRKRLQSDMARLVELTNELKAEVDSTAKDQLSVTVVRKAGEIEKLAHDVKERMKE